jgi:hypothetical protein
MRTLHEMKEHKIEATSSGVTSAFFFMVKIGMLFRKLMAPRYMENMVIA